MQDTPSTLYVGVSPDMALAVASLDKLGQHVRVHVRAGACYDQALTLTHTRIPRMSTPETERRRSETLQRIERIQGTLPRLAVLLTRATTDSEDPSVALVATGDSRGGRVREPTRRVPQTGSRLNARKADMRHIATERYEDDHAVDHS